MTNAIPLGKSYRGVQIGYVRAARGCYLAAWRSSLERRWTIGCVYSRTLADVEDLAIQSIDTFYRLDAEAFVRGRPLTLQEILDIWQEGD